MLQKKQTNTRYQYMSNVWQWGDNQWIHQQQINFIFFPRGYAVVHITILRAPLKQEKWEISEFGVVGEEAETITESKNISEHLDNHVRKEIIRSIKKKHIS